MTSLECTFIAYVQIRWPFSNPFRWDFAVLKPMLEFSLFLKQVLVETYFPGLYLNFGGN